MGTEGLLPFDEARARLLAMARRVSRERVPIAGAAGRVLADDTLGGLRALAPAGAGSLESVFLSLTGRSLRD